VSQIPSLFFGVFITKNFRSLALFSSFIAGSITAQSAFAKVISSSDKNFVIDAPENLLNSCDSPDGTPVDSSTPQLD
jgi:hypothetical protein